MRRRLRYHWCRHLWGKRSRCRNWCMLTQVGAQARPTTPPPRPRPTTLRASTSTPAVSANPWQQQHRALPPSHPLRVLRTPHRRSCPRRSSRTRRWWCRRLYRRCRTKCRSASARWCACLRSTTMGGRCVPKRRVKRAWCPWNAWGSRRGGHTRGRGWERGLSRHCYHHLWALVRMRRG